MDARRIAGAHKIPPKLHPYEWQRNVNDVMWSAFALHPDADSEDIECDREALRENVVRLIEISRHIREPEYREDKLVRTSILVAATRLALAGQLGEMPDRIIRKPFCTSEDATEDNIRAVPCIDWQTDCARTMWSLFLLDPDLASTDIESDLRELRENVARLVRATTQKGGGNGAHREAQCVNSLDLPLIEVSILIAATRLAFAGYFGEMPERVTKSPYKD